MHFYQRRLTETCPDPSLVDVNYSALNPMGYLVPSYVMEFVILLYESQREHERNRYEVLEPRPDRYFNFTNYNNRSIGDDSGELGYEKNQFKKDWVKNAIQGHTYWKHFWYLLNCKIQYIKNRPERQKWILPLVLSMPYLSIPSLVVDWGVFEVPAFMHVMQNDHFTVDEAGCVLDRAAVSGAGRKRPGAAGNSGRPSVRLRT
jgi:hypothetical protein